VRFRSDDVGVGDPRDGEFARQPLQRGHDLERRIAHVGRRQGHDLGAAVGQLHQQPVGGEHAEGLAERRARDAQPFAELALVQLGARLPPRPR
jgi:hypothetical protein